MNNRPKSRVLLATLTRWCPRYVVGPRVYTVRGLYVLEITATRANSESDKRIAAVKRLLFSFTVLFAFAPPLPSRFYLNK